MLLYIRTIYNRFHDWQTYYKERGVLRCVTLYISFMVFTVLGMTAFYMIEHYTEQDLDPRLDNDSYYCLKYEGWNGALYYALSASSSIGFGGLVVCTAGGRTLTLFYCVLGLPFVVYVLADLGDRCCKILVKIYGFSLDCLRNCQCYKSLSCPRCQTNQQNKEELYVTKRGKLCKCHRALSVINRIRNSLFKRVATPGSKEPSVSVIDLGHIEADDGLSECRMFDEGFLALLPWIDTIDDTDPDSILGSIKKHDNNQNSDSGLQVSSGSFDYSASNAASQEPLDEAGSKSGSQYNIAVGLVSTCVIGAVPATEGTLSIKRRRSKQSDEEDDVPLDCPIWLCVLLMVLIIILVIYYMDFMERYGWKYAIYYALLFFIMQEYSQSDKRYTVPTFLLLFFGLATISTIINAILYNINNLILRIERMLPIEIRKRKEELIAQGIPEADIDTAAIVRELLEREGGFLTKNMMPTSRKVGIEEHCNTAVQHVENVMEAEQRALNVLTQSSQTEQDYGSLRQSAVQTTIVEMRPQTVQCLPESSDRHSNTDPIDSQHMEIQCHLFPSTEALADSFFDCYTTAPWIAQEAVDQQDQIPEVHKVSEIQPRSAPEELHAAPEASDTEKQTYPEPDTSPQLQQSVDQRCLIL